MIVHFRLTKRNADDLRAKVEDEGSEAVSAFLEGTVGIPAYATLDGWSWEDDVTLAVTFVAYDVRRYPFEIPDQPTG